MAIDVGPGAIDRIGAGSAQTRVVKDNPANATGTLDTFEIWAAANMTLCEAATFFVVSGDNLSTRDNENIGSVTAGSKQTFTGLSIDVNTNDYLGTYYASGTLEGNDTGGAGAWRRAGDNIPCTNVAFTLSATQILSLYATGTEAGAGDTFFEHKYAIEQGMKPWTAAGMGGVLIE